MPASISEKPFGAAPVNGKLLGLANQALGREVAKRVTVELVATALGDDVEDAAGGLAILGAVGTGLDFNFLHELERQVRARSAESGVGRVTPSRM